MLRGHVTKVLWFLVMGLVALLATEAFTRMLMPQNRDTVLDILVADDTVGYIYEPGARKWERGRDYDVAFYINSLGLRDREYSGPDDGVFRILLIGSSFCVSHGVDIEESLSRTLERSLQEALEVAGSDRRIQVINASNAGYNSYNYWKSYARWAPVFAPDAVVVGYVPAQEHICDPDDVKFLIQDGLVGARYRAGEQPVIATKSLARGMRKYLARNSDLYVLLRNFFYYNERVQNWLGNEGGLGDVSALVDPYRQDPPERISIGLGRAFDFLDRLREETSRDGIPLLVLSIPRKTDVLDSAWNSVLQRAEALNQEVAKSIPTQRLADHCRSIGVPRIDLVPTLEAVGAKGFFIHDNHWNQVGISASAQTVAESWERLGLAPFETERSGN